MTRSMLVPGSEVMKYYTCEKLTQVDYT